MTALNEGLNNKLSTDQINILNYEGKLRKWGYVTQYDFQNKLIQNIYVYRDGRVFVIDGVYESFDLIIKENFVDGIVKGDNKDDKEKMNMLRSLHTILKECRFELKSDNHLEFLMMRSENSGFVNYVKIEWTTKKYIIGCKSSCGEHHTKLDYGSAEKLIYKIQVSFY